MRIMKASELTGWRKSSHSNGGGACVEVVDGLPGIVPVRDSKDPDGPALVFEAPAWQAFTTFAARFDV